MSMRRSDRSKALEADTWIVIGYRPLTSPGDPLIAAKNSSYGPKKSNVCKPK